MAALTVDRVASWIHSLRDAAPRVVLLLGRSQGADALGAVGVASLPELKGHRLAVATASSRAILRPVATDARRPEHA